MRALKKIIGILLTAVLLTSLVPNKALATKGPAFDNEGETAFSQDMTVASLDTTPPVLVGISRDKSAAAVTETVKYQVTMRDANPDMVYLTLRNASGTYNQQISSSQYIQEGSNSVFTIQWTIPETIEAGTVYISYYGLRDKAGNLTPVTLSPTSTLAISTSVEVSNTTGKTDITGPELISIVPTTSSVSTGETVSYTLKLKDANPGSVTLTMRNADGSYTRTLSGGIFSLSDGITTYSLEWTVPDTLPTGYVYVEYYGLHDTAGNSTQAYLEANDPVALGSRINVSNTSGDSDVHGPVLADISVTPSSAFPGERVEYVVKLQEKNPGRTFMTLRQVNGTYYKNLEQTNWDTEDGYAVYRMTWDIPESIGLGNVYVDSLYLQDSVGNKTTVALKQTDDLALKSRVSILSHNSVSLSTPKTVYYPNQDILFNATAASADSMTLTVMKDSNLVVTKDITSGSVSIGKLPVGSYTASVNASFPSGPVESNQVSFQVLDYESGSEVVLTSPQPGNKVTGNYIVRYTVSNKIDPVDIAIIYRDQNNFEKCISVAPISSSGSSSSYETKITDLGQGQNVISLIVSTAHGVSYRDQRNITVQTKLTNIVVGDTNVAPYVSDRNKFKHLLKTNNTAQALTKKISPKDDSYVDRFVDTLFEEATLEGIRPDIVFAQIMLETGWLTYGGTVMENQNNFGGIGATGGGERGNLFLSMREGIRVNVQHLKAYANKEALKAAPVDPRFGYVTRGTAPWVEYLGYRENPNGYGWATGYQYGFTIMDLVETLSNASSALFQISLGTPVLTDFEVSSIVRGDWNKLGIKMIDGFALNQELRMGTGTNSNTEHRYIIKNTTTGESETTPWSENRAAYYTPQTRGHYRFTTEIRQKGSTKVEGSKSFETVIPTGVSHPDPDVDVIPHIGEVSISSSPYYTGKEIKITVTDASEANARANEYELEIEHGGVTTIISSWSDSRTYVFSPQKTGTYLLRIKARNKLVVDGEQQSITINFTVNSFEPPTSVVLSSSKPSYFSEEDIRFTSTATNFISQTLKVMKDGSLILTKDLTSGSANVGTLSPGNYTATVTATNSAGSKTSNQVSFRVIQFKEFAGTNRYHTAALISQATYSKAEVAILVQGENFPDALAAGPLAFALEAPILLTKKDSLPDITKAELHRLGVKKVIILGGQIAVSQTVESLLKTTLGYTCQRIEGSSRYETAIKAAEYLESLNNIPKKVILASGESFADSLSIGSYAASEQIPILLTSTKGMNEKTLQYLKLHKISEVVIVGGPLVVPSSDESKIKNLGIAVTRISGANRERTSAAVANTFYSSSTNAVIVNGMAFPDGLAVAPYAAKLNAPVLLVKDSGVHELIQTYMKENINSLVVTGGNLVIPAPVRELLLNLNN